MNSAGRDQSRALPVLGRTTRTPLQVAFDLWRAKGTFRGFAEFALIGTVTLLFLQQPKLPAFGGLLQSGAALLGMGSSSQANGPEPSYAQDVKRAELPLVPRPSDVAYSESYFDAAPDPLRGQLVRAMRAYRAHDYQRALDALNDADQTDSLILLMRGTTLIALSGAQTFTAGLGLLDRAAEQGEPRAMALLAVLKITGYPGLDRDTEGGRRLLDRAVAAGDAAAARVMGEGYLSGWMGTVDPGRAAHYFRVASDRGDHKAMLRLAEMNINGLGMARNHVEAERLMLAAAEAGHAEAQALLGTWRLTPYLTGVTDNPDSALEWLKRAAAQGEPNAMEYLGRFYLDYGQRTGQLDAERGVEIVRRCAETQRHSPCLFMYATALDFGIGVMRDPVRAYAMYVLANAASPTPKARSRMDELTKSLSSIDLARAHVIATQMLKMKDTQPRPGAGTTFRDVQRSLEKQRQNKP